ncbi:hypothetical protein GCM10025881_38750 [Pseudolysinimonas kribbensis]|uniref:Uncharacterized protein n=1 Tax=Pseudolysinimonas kribbensis TaxID=433641 RepID=A0ABQ6KBT6_9MICO|nr:hypothetical protein GCM10025881_38750 [Pseudolysinimonas kribbensis]
MQLAARIPVEDGDRLLDARPGLDLAGDAGLLVDHALQFGEAPLVGLVEVDRRTEELPRLQRVDLAADAVLLAGLRGEFVLEELRELAVRLRGRLGASSEVGGDGIRRRRAPSSSADAANPAKKPFCASACLRAWAATSATWRRAGTTP